MAEYSISQLSKEFEVTTRTIRHYEELELLSPARSRGFITQQIALASSLFCAANASVYL
jgi:hypothetical protein